MEEKMTLAQGGAYVLTEPNLDFNEKEFIDLRPKFPARDSKKPCMKTLG